MRAPRAASARGWLVGAICSAALWPAFDAPASARTLRVPGDYLDIQAAIDAAAMGDEVLVAPGRYVGTIRIADKHIVLRSEAGPATTVLVGNSERAVVLSNGGELIGFTITSGGTPPVGAAVTCYGSGPVVRGNIIEGNREGPTTSSVGVDGPTTDCVVEGNIFRHNSCFQFPLVAFYNFGFGVVEPPRVVNNLFVDNACQVLATIGPTVIANNTFVGNLAGFSQVFPTSALVLRNNLFTDNDVGVSIRLDGLATPVVERNLVYGNDIDFSEYVPPLAAGNLAVDPMLVDLPGRNLRPQPGSPLVDAGLAEGAPLLDLDGLPRPLDGDGDGSPAVDIGAYELPPTGYPTAPPTVSATRRPTAAPTPTSSEPSPYGPFPDGTTIFVAAANHGAADGSPLRPFPTIQMAIDSAADAAVVGVAAGTYRETVVMRRRVDLRGSGAATTVIDAGGAVPAVRCGDQATIEGFTITNAAGREAAAVDCGPAVTAVVAHNRIAGNHSVAIAARQATVDILDNQVVATADLSGGCPCDGIAASESAVVIRCNTIDASDSSGSINAVNIVSGQFEIDANRVTGRLWLGTSGAPHAPDRVTNNLIRGGNDFSEAINLTSAPLPILVAHNTIVGSGGIFLQVGPDGSAMIASNIVAFGSSGILGFSTGPGVELRHNLVFGNQRSGQNTDYQNLPDQTGVNGNLSVDPLFVDAASGDYHLSCRSPAIEAAGNDARVATDIDGEARPFDANGDGLTIADVGADEYRAVRPFTILRVPDDHARIQEALDAALPCDIVLVAPGTYPGSLRFDGVDVDLRSVAGAQQTRIEGDGGAAVELGPGGGLRGFTVHNPIAGGRGLAVRGAGSRVRQNVFAGDGAYSGIVVESGTPIIDANVVRDNVCGADASGAISIDAALPVITNNVIDGNGCAGIGGGSGNPLVANNTIVDNTTGIQWGPMAAQPIRAVNNIIAGNRTGVRASAKGLPGEDTRWQHNLFFANDRHYVGVTQLAGTLGNLVGNPHFVDAGAGDFHLDAASAAVDAGSSTNAPALDRESLQRPADGNADGERVVDIGAHERGARPLCAGDCNRDAVVTIDELITGVAISLGDAPLIVCAALDGSDDRRLSIDELVRAVARAIDGC